MTANSDKSGALFDFAKQYLVSGVSGSGRFNAALGRPLYLTRGDGCRVTDVDGRTYLDYNLSHGATFLGHNHPGIRKAIQQAVPRLLNPVSSLRPSQASTPAKPRKLFCMAC